MRRVASESSGESSRDRDRERGEGAGIGASASGFDLADLWRDVVARWEQAVVARDHAFHHGVFVTEPTEDREDDPAAFPARMVVLRGVERGGRRLILHTDARSAKVAQVARRPRVGWVFYDPVDQIQVRAKGEATIHRDDRIADAYWAAAAPRSLRGYLAEHAPGRPTPDGGPDPNLPPDARDPERVPPPDQLAARARPNFAVIATTLHSLDWLHVDRTGHRRARFVWPDDDAREPVGEWIMP